MRTATTKVADPKHEVIMASWEFRKLVLTIFVNTTSTRLETEASGDWLVTWISVGFNKSIDLWVDIEGGFVCGIMAQSVHIEFSQVSLQHHVNHFIEELRNRVKRLP